MPSLSIVILHFRKLYMKMEKLGCVPRQLVFVKVAWLLFFLLIATSSTSGKIQQNGINNGKWITPVRLYMKNYRIVMDNGLVRVSLSNPGGDITGIQYNGVVNVLDTGNGEGNRGYWDIFWNKRGRRGIYDRLKGTNFRIIMQDEEQVEVSFTKTWNVSNFGSSVPLNVDKRYIMRRGSSGVYIYAILERLEGWPDVNMDQIRIVFKLQAHKFHYMVLSDDRQRMMPRSKDRKNGQPLAYPEAVVFTNPTSSSTPPLKPEVDDKYQYSSDNKDSRVHGWITKHPPIGFWMITPSDEFRAGGPMKQDLTSHTGPTVLSMFTSTHYTGRDMNTLYERGKSWKKVFGPVFVYLNSIPPGEDPITLWDDAKDQMMLEVHSWPYHFPQSEDFPSSDERGNVAGQLLVHDKYINERLMWGNSAYVGLAAPGDVGSWQRECQGYQFWTDTDDEGYFVIENVRAGDYNLYAWVRGIVGDYKYEANITITPGCEIKLGVLVYEPPRNGPTLWKIGYPDRTAAEFFVPHTYPTLTNNLYTDHPTDGFRQYGLWERYTDLYPKHDLVYTVGTSNYHQDWFFAQVPRKTKNKTYKATTWQIIFELQNVTKSGNYTLQLALASASESELQVRFNDAAASRPHFTTRLIGRDNAIARHGIHGLYWFYSINVPSYLLGKGKNIIYLTQSRGSTPFHGIMYDYIRLEGPSSLACSST